MLECKKNPARDLVPGGVYILAETVAGTEVPPFIQLCRSKR